MKRRLLGLMCLLLSAAGTLAAHLTVNPHAFRYDMTVYALLQMNGTVLTDYSGYEIAAFCGDECRGVAKVQVTTDGTPYLYIRIYSNETQGETISFRAYRQSEVTEQNLPETCIFESGSLVGTPGEPLVLTMVSIIRGDANGDGMVSIADVTAIINKINGVVSDKFNEAAADVNGDGLITIADVTGVINIINQ